MEEIYHVADFESKFNDAVKRFQDAGWTQEESEVFSYTNATCVIRAHMHLGDEAMTVVLTDTNDHTSTERPHESEVRIEYGAKLDAAIDALIAHKDSLGISTTDAFFQEVRRSFPDTIEFVDR